MNKHTKQAQVIIEAIVDELGPGFAAYWVIPNTILTLSGVRAYSDGVFYSAVISQRKEWQKEIQECLPILSKHLDITFFDSKAATKTTMGDVYVSYDLTHQRGIEYVLKHTKLLKKTQKDIVSLSGAKGPALAGVIAKELRSNTNLKELNAGDLSQIAFGILVGYPDDAVVGAVKYWKQPQGAFSERLVDANIRGASYYMCPQPVYSYPRDLITDKTIQRHEKLWSEILMEFYTSSFHQKLSSEDKFIQKMHELGNLFG